MTSREDHDDTENFTTWVQENAGFVLRMAYLWSRRDPHRAEEIAQEALANLFKAWPDEEKRRRIRENPSYVFRTVKNTYLDYRKVPSRTNEYERELPDEKDLKIRDGIGTLEIGDLLDVREAVLQLDDNERELVYLVYYEGYSVKDAGARLGLTPGQEYRVHEKAKRNLEKYLKEEGQGGR